MKPLYTAKVRTHGGREGSIESITGNLKLDISMPKALGGSGAAGTNPEELFAAGYGACFESALRHVARLEKVALETVSVVAEVTIGTTDGKGFDLSVLLNVEARDSQLSIVFPVVEKAHSVCPYSRATKGNIPVTIDVIAMDGSRKLG